MTITVVPLLRLPAGVGPFSYTVEDDAPISVGVVVQIPFRSKKALGIVIGIGEDIVLSRPTPLQAIHAIIAKTPLVSSAWCRSLMTLAGVYHVNPGTMAISLLPAIGPRMVSEKTLETIVEPVHPAPPIRHTLVDTGAAVDAAVRSAAESAAGTCIIVCPESSTAQRLAHELAPMDPLLYLRAGSTKTTKAIWHTVRRGERRIVIGTRAAALLPFAPGTTVLVIHPQDDGHTQWDAQPHTTTLDVLAIRRRNEDVTVITISHTATTEQLLERSAWTRAWNPTPLELQRIDNAQLVRARLYQAIPDPVREILSQATSTNPAVILVNRTDESVVLRCADCETVIASRVTTTCPHCKSTNLLARGMTVSYLARIAQEQFPDLRVVQVSSDQPATSDEAHIIVATDAIFTEDILAHASVVWVPNADARFSRPWYRAVENALYTFRELAARAPHARLLLSTWNAEHPLWSALQDTDALRRLFATELQSRKAHHYPPYVRLIRCTPGSLPNSRKSAITGTTVLHRLPPDTWVDALLALTQTLAREDRVEPNPLSP